MELKDKILNYFKEFPEGKRSLEVAKALNVSRPTVLNYINLLEVEGKIVKFINGPKTWYAYTDHANKLIRGGIAYHQTYQTKGLREEDAYDEVNVRYLKKMKLSDRVISIIRYGFQEMLNNAIEHSGSSKVYVEFSSNKNEVQFIVHDWGIGVFNSIKNKLHRASELEAVQDVLKGKTTTSPKNHSGEGIFFTSKAADTFLLKSFKYTLNVDNKKHDAQIIPELRTLRGTLVIFTINKNTHKHLTDIFKRFTENDQAGFTTTEIRVKLFTMFSHHVSRSQARRVLEGLDKFSHIILDFTEVVNIGQAFADEIFRVFQNKHPSIKISAVNMQENVAFMVNRARNTSK